MSALLRTLLALSVTSLVLVGCGDKEAAPEATPEVTVAPAETAPVAASPTAAVEAAPATEPGGYVPTPEERVPGITVDMSAQPVTESMPAEAAAPATEAAPAASETAPAAQ
ncbi:MAG TPA: hypothetical protein PL131_06740 [Methylotenera sp.]|nr:hypothetical protein [Methylotenera sp.]HPH05556.1 hypothetical protein [Methylotenera sp.]HPN00030.1 hypothetical protein [Methylotenera sp.]